MDLRAFKFALDFPCQSGTQEIMAARRGCIPKGTTIECEAHDYRYIMMGSLPGEIVGQDSKYILQGVQGNG